MAQADEPRFLTWQPNRLYAAIFVVAALTLLYAAFSGPRIVDWDAYSYLFDQDGGWLRRQSRDPLFLALLRTGRSAFGGNGYESFRLAVFAIFTVGCARVAYAMAPDRTWSILLALVVLAAFLLKSLAQIREGLALLMVLWPLVRTYRWGKSNLIESGVWIFGAPFMHSGATLFAGLWVLAVVLSFLPRALSWKGISWLLLLLGVVCGAVIAALVAASASTLEFSLQDLGIDTASEVIGGAAKNAYWVINGAAVLVLMRQLVSAGSGSGRFGQALALGLGSFVLPLIYTVCLILVFRQFYLPAVTSMTIRLLFSSMQLSLLIIGLRGRVNIWSIGISIGLILDQIRLLFESPIL